VRKQNEKGPYGPFLCLKPLFQNFVYLGMSTEELRAEVNRLVSNCEDKTTLLKVAKLLHEHIYNNPAYDQISQRIFEKYDNLFRRLAD